jgi:hypothetical protein
MKAMMATNDASVYDKVDEEVLAAEFLARWERLDDRVSEVAAYRCAVVIGGDGRLVLQLQGLPANASGLSRRHQFKG